MLQPTNQNLAFLKCSPDNVDNFEGCPETAVVTLSRELENQVSLRTLVVGQLNVKSIVAETPWVTFHAWEEDEGGIEVIGEELPTVNHSLHVAKEGIWFSGSRLVSGRRFRTPVVDVKQLGWGHAPGVSANTKAALEAETEAAWLDLVELVDQLGRYMRAKRREFVVRNKKIWKQYRDTTNERRNSHKR
jgi:hypothetical protein